MAAVTIILYYDVKFCIMLDYNFHCHIFAIPVMWSINYYYYDDYYICHVRTWTYNQGTIEALFMSQFLVTKDII